MKKNRILFLLFIFIYTTGQAQTTLDYKICKWYNNKKVAVTISFDDNLADQFNEAVPVLNARKIPATFFVITGNVPVSPGWAVLQNAALAGHEIGSHTVTHPTLISGITEAEVKNSRDSINKYIPNQKCLTMGWPFGNKNATTIGYCKKYGYIAGRSASVGNNMFEPYEPWTSTDYWFKIGAFMNTSTTTGADIAFKLDSAIKVNGWFAPFYHGISSGYQAPGLIAFIAHMDSIKARENNAWITTFTNANLYHQERRGASITAIAENSTSWTLKLTDTCSNNTIYNHPLTVRLVKPNWAIDSIKQGTKKITYITDADTLQFNAIPDDENIIFFKSTSTRIRKVITQYTSSISINPNPATSTTTITFTSPKTAKLLLLLYDLNGKPVRTLICKSNFEGTESINLDAFILPAGTYIVKMVTDTNNTTAKFIVTK